MDMLFGISGKRTKATLGDEVITIRHAKFVAMESLLATPQGKTLRNRQNGNYSRSKPAKYYMNVLNDGVIDGLNVYQVPESYLGTHYIGQDGELVGVLHEENGKFVINKKCAQPIAA